MAKSLCGDANLFCAPKLLTTLDLTTSELSRAQQSPSSLLRATLLGTVAATALFIIAPQAGHAVCTHSGTTVTCTGDQSAGIANGTDFTAPPVDTLIVKDLTGAIAPGASVDGINFGVAGGNNVTISSDTGGFGISTTGANLFNEKLTIHLRKQHFTWISLPVAMRHVPLGRQSTGLWVGNQLGKSHGL